MFVFKFKFKLSLCLQATHLRQQRLLREQASLTLRDGPQTQADSSVLDSTTTLLLPGQRDSASPSSVLAPGGAGSGSPRTSQGGKMPRDGAESAGHGQGCLERSSWMGGDGGDAAFSLEEGWQRRKGDRIATAINAPPRNHIFKTVASAGCRHQVSAIAVITVAVAGGLPQRRLQPPSFQNRPE